MSRRALQRAEDAAVTSYDAVLKPISAEQAQLLRATQKRSHTSGGQRSMAWQEGYAAGQIEGYAAGLAAGREEALEEERERYQAEADQFAQRLDRFVASIEERMPEFLLRLESELSALAVIIAERILHQELTLGHDSVVSIAKAALSEIIPTQSLTLHVNPSDSATIESRLPELVRSVQGLRTIEISTDPSFRGGCLIETDGGAVDARVEQMLAKVAAVAGAAA